MKTTTTKPATIAEAAKVVRARLKAELGATSKDVSVTVRAETIFVTIRNPNLSLDAVEAIANEQRDVSRCEVTGEILCGGNRYVRVSHSEEAMRPLSLRYQAAMTSVDEGAIDDWAWRKLNDRAWIAKHPALRGDYITGVCARSLADMMAANSLANASFTYPDTIATIPGEEGAQVRADYREMVTGKAA
jgi:hypothetical protein